MDLQLSLFNLLSLVVYLFMMMKTHLLIVSPLIITRWRSIGEQVNEKQRSFRLLFK
jgi:hypothetical protein